LHILHAWGAKDQPGLYGEICRTHGVKRLTVRDVDGDSPSESLAEACKRLLESTDIEPVYDSILIDEGQDLVVADHLRYEDRQPIYWLAYEALRKVDGQESDQRRLIWAYDEAQSLDSLKIPQAKELFGEDRSRIVSGTYPGGIQKSEIMSRCYRTPGPILVAAHALGMGLKRDGSMIAGFTRQEDWEAIGYEVDGNFTASGNKITLMRPDENSPNPVPDLWESDVIEFERFGSRQEELDAVTRKVRHNIEHDGLNPSRDILIIAVGENSWKLRKQMAKTLPQHGVDSYTPKALELNVANPRYPNTDPNAFWKEGGVTVSGIHRAKGNEAEVVYIIGVDQIAREEASPRMRNQLFVALTRSKGWVHLSGTGQYDMYDEIDQVIDAGTIIEFSFSRPSRDMGDDL
jgi:superfamily I DNA and RNA helicase